MIRRKPHDPPVSLFSFQDIITAVTGIILLLTLLCTLALVHRQKRAAPMPANDLVEAIRRSLQEVREELAALQAELSRGDRWAAALASLTLDEIRRESEIAGHELRRLQAELARLQAEAARLNDERMAWQAKRLHCDTQPLEDAKKEAAELQCQIQNIRKSNPRFYRPDPSAGKTAWLVDISGKQLLLFRVGDQTPVARFQESLLSGGVPSFMHWTSTNASPATDYFILAIRPSGIRAYDKVREQLRARGFDVGLDLFREEEAIVPESDTSRD